MKVSFCAPAVFCHPGIAVGRAVSAFEIQWLRVETAGYTAPRTMMFGRRILSRASRRAVGARRVGVRPQWTVGVGAVVRAGGLVVKIIVFLLGRWGGGSGLGVLRRFGPFRILLRFRRVDGDVLCLRYVVRIRGVGVGEVMIENPVRFAIESTDASGLLLTVRPHVGVVVVLVPPRTLLLPSRLCAFLEEFLIHVLASTRYHTSSAQPRGPCRSAQRRAVRSLAPQYGGFVVIPVTLAEIDTAVLRPEEEPDPAEDEKDAN